MRYETGSPLEIENTYYVLHDRVLFEDSRYSVKTYRSEQQTLMVASRVSDGGPLYRRLYSHIKIIDREQKKKDDCGIRSFFFALITDVFAHNIPA